MYTAPTPPCLNSFETKERKHKTKTRTAETGVQERLQKSKGFQWQQRSMKTQKCGRCVKPVSLEHQVHLQPQQEIQVRCVSPHPYSPSAETILWLSAKWRSNFKAIARHSSLQLSVIVETQWMGTCPASWANFTLAGWKACVSYSLWAMYAASLKQPFLLVNSEWFPKSVYMSLLVFQDHFSVTYQWRTIFSIHMSLSEYRKPSVGRTPCSWSLCPLQCSVDRLLPTRHSVNLIEWVNALKYSWLA